MISLPRTASLSLLRDFDLDQRKKEPHICPVRRFLRVRHTSVPRNFHRPGWCPLLDVDTSVNRTSTARAIFHRTCYTGRPPLRRNDIAKPRTAPKSRRT